MQKSSKKLYFSSNVGLWVFYRVQKTLPASQTLQTFKWFKQARGPAVTQAKKTSR